MKEFITSAKNSDGRDVTIGKFTFGIMTQGNIDDIKIHFCTFDIGKEFYVDYLGALRKCRIKGIYFFDGHYNEVASKAIEYEIAGAGTVIINRSLKHYASVEDFRAGKTTPQLNRVEPYEFKRKIMDDIKGEFDCDYVEPRTDNYSGRNFYFSVWVWDGTKAVKKEVGNFLLHYDGTRYSLVLKEPIQGAFPSKELCEKANEIKVIDF